MEIQQLKGFIAVAYYGSFSVAARKTFRSQPAVSLQIMSLEEEFKIRLFDRLKGHKVVLTAEGKLFYEMIKPIVNQLDNIPKGFSEAINQQSHVRLRLATHGSVIALILPKTLGQFKELYPGATISIYRHPRPEMIELLKFGEVDLVITSLLQVPTWANYETFYRFKRFLICPKSHKLAKKKGQIKLEDLANEAFVLPPPVSNTRIMVDNVFSAADLSYSLALEVTDIAAQKIYVQMEWGLSVINEYYLYQQDRKSLAIKDVSHIFGEGQRALVSHKQHYLSKPIKDFITILKRNC